MSKTVIIPGRFPGINQYVEECRRNRFGGNKAIKESEIIIVNALQRQVKDILTPPIRLLYTFYEPNKRRDKDNIAGFFHKVFQDSLVKAELIDNDGWDYIEDFHDYFAIDRKNPRIEIRIIEGSD